MLLIQIEFHVCFNNRTSDFRNLTIPNISLFNDRQGNPYSANVLRDFLHHKRVETMFHNKVLHSVNICTVFVIQIIYLNLR